MSYIVSKPPGLAGYSYQLRQHLCIYEEGMAGKIIAQSTLESEEGMVFFVFTY